ncbi:FAD:protein FMN transferase [Desulfovibrio sp. Fe33]|uniref:FAD:protein FMN transferase n=1 Tax=Desulfovibrio sp. Fe33 TaxID=3020842 RepID=UPI00234C895C|nr:FAD:protein FMN transferase [Desulfovibrio sp. Fe33]
MVSRRVFLGALGAFGAIACAAPFAGLTGAVLGRELPERTETRLMMGTYATISVRNASRALADEAVERAFAAMGRAETLFTRRGGSSPLGVLNAQGVLREAPGPVAELLGDAILLSKRSGNGFNPATAPVLEALAAHGARSIEDLPAPVRRDLGVLASPDGIVMTGTTIRLTRTGMGVSLDGIAKGRIVDIAARELEKSGIADFLVNAGGDMRTGPDNTAGWMVGIQNAADPARNLSTFRLCSGAVATSGNYESRASKGYDHLVRTDPAEPPVRAVTVIAPTCVQTDALATALFAMGKEKGSAFMRRNPGCGCLWQTENGLVPCGDRPFRA